MKNNKEDLKVWLNKTSEDMDFIMEDPDLLKLLKSLAKK
ncbi:hypothetical protein LD120_00061 [Mesoplasma sp. JKS002657]|nr:hypothetical protein [Mesoplasma sp. JKS002661]MCL8215811.1 hypothetical protein [Mesoplasma sp. JKS002657]